MTKSKKSLAVLNLVRDNLPDEIVVTLEKRRGNGRDDFPIRAMWNALERFALRTVGLIFAEAKKTGLHWSMLHWSTP